MSTTPAPHTPDPTPGTLALFGATGGTGGHVLEQALAAGWTVRALARNPGRLDQHPGLTALAGDVQDADAVARTVEGADAVVSVFGHVKGSPARLQTDGTRHIVAAMHAHGIRRIVSLSGGGVPAEHDRPKAADKVIRFLLRRLSGTVLDDAIEHAQLLRDSDLDWTIVRGPRLTNAPRTGRYRVGWVGVDASTKVARADLADFILRELTEQAHLRSMPFVSS